MSVFLLADFITIAFFYSLVFVFHFTIFVNLSVAIRIRESSNSVVFSCFLFLFYRFSVCCLFSQARRETISYAASFLQRNEEEKTRR